MSASVLDTPIIWEGEPMADDDRQVMVARPLTEILDQFSSTMRHGFENVQRGVDSANSALALKADKSDLDAIRDRVDQVEEGLASLKGWKAGFFGAAGIAVGVLGAIGVPHIIR